MRGDKRLFYEDIFTGLQLFIGMSLDRNKALASLKMPRVQIIWVLAYEALDFLIISFYAAAL